MRTLLAGGIARDHATANRLALEGESQLIIAAQHHHPGLIDAAKATGGSFYHVKDIADPAYMAELAEAESAEMVWINQDDALANNVVGAIRERIPDILSASSDGEASRLEWDKIWTREEIVGPIDKKYGTSFNPLYKKVTTADEVREAVTFFREQGIEMVVKPRYLTGGKGVQVMGPHWQTYEEGETYAVQIVQDSVHRGALIEEKLEGVEFNIEAFTDGTTMASPVFLVDYAYRNDGDTGPGTGGMGAFTVKPDERMPFLTDDDYASTTLLMERVLERALELGLDYRGVLYASFMKTAKGIKLIEFNARIGCPEGVNIVESLDPSTSLTKVLQEIATGELRKDSVQLKKLASTVLYLVSPRYAYGPGPAYQFELNKEINAAHDVGSYFAASRKLMRANPSKYETVGVSRTVALAALGDTPWEARAKILEAIRAGGVKGPLEYRLDVGDEAYIRALVNRLAV